MDIQTIINTLTNNQEKSFVKRILNPNKFPTLDNKDGTISTHSMATGEADGRFFAYPTVLMGKDKVLTRYSDQDAWNHAVKTDNIIEFASQEEADFFAENYKKVWGK